MSKINKIAFIITEPRHFNFFTKIMQNLDTSEYNIILNDYNKKTFHQVFDSANEQKIPYMLASDIKKSGMKYKVVLSVLADREGGEKKLQIGWPFRYDYKIFLPGINVNKLGWPANFMKNILLIPVRFFKKEKFDNPLKISMPIANDIGEIKVLSESSMDLVRINFPRYPAHIVYDYYFCINNLHEHIVVTNTNKPALVVGYPRYDNLPTKDDALRLLENELQIKISKKIIFWVPSDISNEYINSCYESLASLLNDFHIIIRPHPDSWDANRPTYEQKLWRDMSNKGFIIDKFAHREMGSMYKAADFVFCDIGGPVFSAIYLNKKIILFNPKKKRKNRGLYLEDIEAAIVNINYEEIETKTIEAILNDKNYWHEQKMKQKNLRAKIFGKLNSYEGSRVAANKLRELLNS